MRIIRKTNNDMSMDGVTRMKGRVMRNMSALARNMRSLADAESNLTEIEDKIQALNRSAILSRSTSDDLIQALTLLNSYSFYIRIKSECLREIDTASANVAGCLTFLLEESFMGKDADLKVWVRNRILDLDDVRVLEIPGKYQKKLPLPMANGLMIPFLETTRTGENAAWFASVRNAIRRLLD